MDWYYDMKLWMGSCSADAEVERIKKAVEAGKSYVEAAETAHSFTKMNPQFAKKLSSAKEGLGKIGDTLDKVDTICKDIAALRKIHSAIATLDEANIMTNNPKKAAQAFGDLFSGFGTLAKHLPSPASEWAEFLEGCGSLFVNVGYYGLQHSLRRMERSEVKELRDMNL